MVRFNSEILLGVYTIMSGASSFRNLDPSAPACSLENSSLIRSQQTFRNASSLQKQNICF